MARRGSNRFVISSFPPPTQMDPHFAQNTWATLREAIFEITNRNTSNLSFEQLYRFSYNMVLHRHGDYLYNGLTSLLTKHLQGVAEKVRSKDPPCFLPEIKKQWGWFSVSLAHVRDVLMYMDRHYVRTKQKKPVHELGLSLFRDVVVRHPAVLPRLSDMLLDSIDKERNGALVDIHLIRAITKMLAELGEDKNGRSVYANVFEDGFLDRTEQFYAREARLYLAETACSDYLRKAHKRIQEERMRVDTYLEAQTEAKVRKVAEQELISKYMSRLVDMENSGFLWMLRNDRVDDLRLMYSLFKGIENGDETLRGKLKAEVLEKGTELVQDSENVKEPVTLIDSILALKNKYDKIISVAFNLPATPPSHAMEGGLNAVGSTANPSVSDAPYPYGFGASGDRERAVHGEYMDVAADGSSFGQASSGGPSALGNAGMGSAGSGFGLTGATGVEGVTGDVSSATNTPRIPDKRFVSAVNEAFERFINSFPRAAEYISLYVDKLLRKDMNEEEVEAKLDAVMTLFRFLNERDVFERYYKQHLTKRLLHARTASSDAERSFISKMKTECGYLYTSKMEVMFNDMKVSEETTDQFRAKVAKEGIDMHNIELNVAVLTTMSWPITPSDRSDIPAIEKVNLPLSAVHCTRKFEDYYYSKHEGRRLTWQPLLGTADIRGRFGGGTRTVDLCSVSAYAMCILMLFNDKDCLTCKEIGEATQIPEKELHRHLQSLSLAKYRVLRKEPREKEVKPEDKFYFNDDFTTKNRRIKMQVISAAKENGNERNQTRGRIDDDRRPLIDTAIVRIMKHRKVLGHTALVVEVTSQLSSRFEPNLQDIKKRIESLVEREYIERDTQNRQVYKYLA
eukprot:GFKZ01001381.1.p1 GENE.GFKZ01001381.1~~GFKZ01001381.1.p1  ORF type:complete len:852 (+),score=133.99 GFKZ01001381.1:654-3209(+)